LSVLARGAADRSWLQGHGSVDIMSPNQDVAAMFASSRASIAPLLEGGGVRIKILESLAAGCPVVATPIGGEGLALPGLTHTDDPVRFAETCLTHLRESDPSTRRNVQASVAAVHEAGVVARRLVDFWRCER
jgi:glycosyltransferase involved in cell wall biosynthesis